MEFLIQKSQQYIFPSRITDWFHPSPETRANMINHDRKRWIHHAKLLIRKQKSKILKGQKRITKYLNRMVNLLNRMIPTSLI